MSVHLCALFCNNMQLVHEDNVRRITKDLVSTSTYMDFPDVNRRLYTRVIVYIHNKEKGIKCYTDAEISGGWDQSDADNAENAISRTGYVITYAGCPVLLCIKLQN